MTRAKATPLASMPRNWAITSIGTSSRVTPRSLAKRDSRCVWTSFSSRVICSRKRSSDRFVDIWLEQGYRALLEAIANEDPAWLSVQFEAARRVRTDKQFREELERLDEDLKNQRESRFARLRGVVRDDVPIDVIAQFLGTLANGVAFARVTDDPMPDLDHLLALIETGVAPR